MLMTFNHLGTTKELHSRRGYFDVSVELLLGLFLAPEGTELLGIEPAPHGGALRFVITHPNLEPAAEGASPENVEPRYSTLDGVLFAEWPFVDDPVEGDPR